MSVRRLIRDLRENATPTGLLRMQVVRYILVGLSGMCLETLLFSLLYRLGLHLMVANVLAYVTSLTWCFSLHMRFTYVVRTSGLGSLLSYYVQYSSLMAVQLVVGSLMLHFFIESVGLWPELAKLLQIAIVTPVSYLIQKHSIFRKHGPVTEASPATTPFQP